MTVYRYAQYIFKKGSFPLTTHTLPLLMTLSSLEWVKNFSRGSEKWHLLSRIYDTAFSSAAMFSLSLGTPPSVPCVCTSP